MPFTPESASIIFFNVNYILERALSLLPNFVLSVLTFVNPRICISFNHTRVPRLFLTLDLTLALLLLLLLPEDGSGKLPLKSLYLNEKI